MDAVLENSSEVTNAINNCVYGLLNLQTNDARKLNIFDDQIKESIESWYDNRVVKLHDKKNIIPKLFRYSHIVCSIIKILKHFSKNLQSRKYEHVEDVYELNRRIWEYLENYSLQQKYIETINMFDNIYEYDPYTMLPSKRSDSVYSAIDIIMNMDLGNIDENTCQEFHEKRNKLANTYEILYNGLCLNFDI